MVSDAAATKAPIAKVADKVSGVFVPAVITIAAVTIIGMASGRSRLLVLPWRAVFPYWLSAVRVHLGLATPVAIMVGNGMGAKHGILFKTAVSLEETGKVQIVALDKTGTITSGEPKVTDIIPVEGIAKDDLMHDCIWRWSQKSEHPLAKAIVVHGRGTERLQ